MKPRTYPRRSTKQSPIVTDGRIDTVLPLGTLRRLLALFEKDLHRRPRTLLAGLSSCDRAYFRFLFSLIVHAGVAGPDAWKEITSLRFNSLAGAGSGRLSIPRKGGEVPVILAAITQDCAASLGLHLMRSRSPSNYFPAPFPPEGFLIPGMPDPSAKPDAALLADVHCRFLKWLNELAAPLHLNITFRQLCDLSRMRLAYRGRPILAGTLLGLHLSNPIPTDQINSVSRLADTSAGWNGRPCISNCAGKEFRPRPGILQRHRRKKADGGVETGTDWDLAVAPLRKIVRSYTRAEKRKAHVLRPVVRERLVRFIRKGIRRLGKPDAVSWAEFANRTPGIGSGRRWAELNAVLLAEWIAGLIRSYPPNTVKGSFSDLMQVYRHLPGLLYRGMTHQTVTSVLFGLRMRASSLERLSASLRSHLSYLQKEHGFTLPDLPWWSFRNRRNLHEQRILIDEEIAMLLAHFPGTGPMDSVMRCGILLIQYFGLRLSELCRLRICDVWMAGRPTVLVWNSKGGGSRWIETLEIPPEAVSIIKTYYAQRASESSANPTARFLVRPDGKPLPHAGFDARFREAMQQTGLSTGEGRRSLTIHGLRHNCANGWWLGGLPMVEVARRLGHKSLDTTIPHYIHSQPAKELMEPADQGGGIQVTRISRTAMAALCGTSRRAVYYRLASTLGIDNPQATEFLSLLQAHCGCGR